ncbi:DUF979 domain-containing protein [Undibacterium sp. Ji22W]|uniref:DUF979 domain-containing protein n=1 Tax=Undibacterium sp. Ji22W TaxID=3413038 RepID=UPI003BF44C34
MNNAFNSGASLLSIQIVFYLIGIIVMAIAYLSVRDLSNPKRWTTGLFWFLFGVGFLFGDAMIAGLGKPLTHKIQGVIVLILALIAGSNLLGSGQHQSKSNTNKIAFAEKFGNRLFLPAVAIPLVTVLLTLAGKNIQVGDYFLLDQKNLTLACLTIACLFSVTYACKITGGTPLTAIQESRRLVDAMGWALILPLMLAMLGGVFVAAKTGQSIQTLVTLFVNPDSKLALIVIYCVGMALFTMIMGNAFAAFPVMAAGIALPFLILQHHANPAPLVAIGMLSGYCGTLMTPMAANFNIIPAALLELEDKYLVIKYQIPTALAVLVCNIVLMYFLI